MLLAGKQVCVASDTAPPSAGQQGAPVEQETTQQHGTAKPAIETGSTDPSPPDDKVDGDCAETAMDQPPTAEDTADNPAEPLWPDIAEVLKLLVSNGILDPDSPADRRRVIEAVLKAGGHGLDFKADATMVGPKPTDSDNATSRYHDPIPIYDVFHYLRIPRLNKTDAEHLAEAVLELEENGLRGLVLDLRCSSGRFTQGAVNLRTQLHATDAPVVVLISDTTSGAPELLAQLLTERHNTVSIGTPTKGQPFPFVHVRLGHGGAVSLPDANAAGADLVWPPVPVHPDIELDTSVDCETLNAMELSADNLVKWLADDTQLRRAADLLVMIRGVRDETH